MSGFRALLEQAVLDQLLRGSMLTDLTPVKVSLHTDDPGEGNTGANEVAGGSYARISVPTDKWTPPALIGGGRSASYNVEDLSFADMPDCTVKYVGIWSADGTIFMMAGLLDSAGTHVTAGTTFVISAGKLRVSLS